MEHTAQRLLLEEQMLATLTDGTHSDDARAFQTRDSMVNLATRLRSGVEQYVHLTQEATVTATSMGNLIGHDDLREAEDQLAGLNLGLKEVQKISADES